MAEPAPCVLDPSALNGEAGHRVPQSLGMGEIGGDARFRAISLHELIDTPSAKQTDYSVKSSPWLDGKGDLVRQVSDAAKKYGLKFGVYLSPWDRHEPRYKNSADYDEYYSSELQELITHYGNLTEFWLDGAGSGGHVYNFPGIIDELRIYQPDALVFTDVALFEYGDIRWVGNEDGTIPYENWNVIDRHGYLRWRPIEADTPLRKNSWFWHPNNDSTLKSVDELVSTYDETIGRGGQLMLGLAPDRRGLLPDADVQRLQEFGTAVRQRLGQNLMEKRIRTHDAAEAALDGDPVTFWSAPQDSHHAVIEASFAALITFDHVLMMERLNEGQRVQNYRVEAWDGKQWRTVADGRAIGHKRIDGFAAISATRVRLNILSSAAGAEIREFQLYDFGRRTP